MYLLKQNFLYDIVIKVTAILFRGDTRWQWYSETDEVIDQDSFPTLQSETTYQSEQAQPEKLYAPGHICPSDRNT